MTEEHGGPPLLWIMNSAVRINIAHESYRLPNGLTVILHEDHSLPQVVVNLWYDVGSKDEVPGRSGFAHLFEHLMFMGTGRLPDGGFDDLMEQHGGWNNAWTAEDATDFYAAGPRHLLSTLLWMEADRMEGLGRAMTQEKLDRQREVVRNERRQTSEDTPYGEVWLVLSEVMYPPSHPYGHPVIGSHADLQAASLEDVIRFFDTWYVPNNASLVVAGDFDSAQTKPLIASLFGHLASRPLPIPRAVAVPDRPQQAVRELTDRVQVPMTVMVWHSAAQMQPGDAALDVVGAILSEGRTSRLYQRMVQTESLVLEVAAMQHSQLLGSLFLVEAKPTEAHTLEELEAVILEELARLTAEGPTALELERVRNQLELSFVQGLESLQGRASQLNRYQSVVGTPDALQADLDRYRAVTAADVQAEAARLTRERVGIIRVYPADDALDDDDTEE